MKRIKVMAPLLALVAVLVGTAGATAAGVTRVPPDFAISSGTAVPRQAFSEEDRVFLDASGATGPATRIGAQRGVAFYAIDGADGGRCYGFAFERSGSVQLASLGCSPATVLEQPIIDMSTIVMDPVTGNWSLRALQGIAADGVSAVGVIGEGGQFHAAPVIGNVYRLTTPPLPAGQAVELVAFDASGNRIFAVPLNTSRG